MKTKKIDYKLSKTYSFPIYKTSIIELPLFSKSNRVQVKTKYQYNFNNNESLLISPSKKTQDISQKILQSYDEKIFFTLLYLYLKEIDIKKIDTNDNIMILNLSTIITTLDLAYGGYNVKRIKDSLQRLKNVDILYENQKTQKQFNILDLAIIVDKKNKTNELSLELKKKIDNIGPRNDKFKELVIISFDKTIISLIENDFFKKINIERMISFDNATVRKLYLILSLKKKDNLCLTLDCNYLCSRIPLKWDTKSISSSIKSLENTFEKLKKQNIINRYELIKEQPLKNSKIKVTYSSKNKTNNNKKQKEDNKMASVLVFANQKGGIAKTTSVANVGKALAEKGKKVLLIDFDPQGNLSLNYDIDLLEVEGTIYDVIKANYIDKKNISLSQVIQRKFGVDVIPNDISAARMDLELGAITGRELMLERLIGDIKEQYDYILIDCQPSLSLSTVNAFVAADSVYVPLHPDYLGLAGLSELFETIDDIKAGLRVECEIKGVFLTIVNTQTILYRNVKEELEDTIPNKVMSSIIRQNEELKKATANGMPIFEYNKNCHGAEDYKALAEEILSIEEGGQ